MKVKKLFLSCLTILGIGTTQMLPAQSTIPQRDLWVIGQNVVSFDPTLGTQTTVNQLPIHPSTGGFSPWPAPNPTTMYLNNAYHDESGSLLFYIADGNVYDFEGRYIGGLYTSAGTAVYGYKDIAIVPDKCNPSVFYIVAIIDRANGHNGQSSAPLFAKLEIGLNINAVTFDNTQNAGASGDPLADGRLGFATSNRASGWAFPEMLPLLNNNTGWENEPLFTFAVSKRQADGEYLLFISSGDETAIIKGSDLAVAGNSNTFPTTLYTSVGFGNQNPNSECELYQKVVSNDNTNVIRIANSSGLINGYFYQDFTYVAGAIITAGPAVLLNDILTNNAGGWIPHGLEFSENGQYLYFTTSRVVTPFPPTYGYRLNYFDLNLANPVSQNITNSQLNYNVVNSFLSSQIELGKDDAFYLWNGTQLGRLQNINNPASIVPADFTTVNLPIADQTNFDLLNGDTRMMNDQVDGQAAYPPLVIGNTPEDKQCCIVHKKYDADIHNLGFIPPEDILFGNQNHNQVWSPGALNNPFGSLNGVIAIKSRLVIPAGYTLTINNMTVEYKIFINDPNPSNVNNIGAFVDGAKCVLEAPQTNASGNIITLNGGTLILNNTIFKSIYACEGMWDGIEVQGSPNAPQQVITTGPLNIKTQARLIVNAGSIIQDAYFGAANYAFDLTNGDFANNFKTPTLQSGGIIIGTANSTFKNNRVGVCFMPYFTGNVVSNFKNTSFLIDAPLKDPLITPHAMALLNEIKVMNFKSCTFLNSATNDYPIVPVAPAPVILHGILANSSSFSIGSSVLAATIPYGSGCSFTNLTYGIKAFNATVNTALVQSSNFYNNYRGSYFANYSGSSTTVTQRNRYFVYEYPTGTPANDAAYGHYLDYCNNFKVQENRFYYNSYNETTPNVLVANKYNAYGCIINEENPNQTCFGAGYRGDEVYKNLFKEINIGTQAQGFNAEQPKTLLFPYTNQCYLTNSSAPEHIVGLKYACNTFSGTDENDITVMQDATPLPIGSPAKPGRISYLQGGGTSSGNVHSHVSTPINCGAFNAASEHELYIDKTGINDTKPNYLVSVYNNAATERLFCFSPFVVAPNPNSTLPNTGVQSVIFGGPNPCPSKVGAITRGVVALTADYNNLIPLIKNAELPLLQGDDAALTTTISNGTPGQIQNTLLSKSPYLSDAVLVAAIRKGLPNGTIKNIILPNSPVTNYVKTVLDSLPLPNGIRKQINDAQTGISQRAIQEGLLTNVRDEQHSIAIDAMTALLLDSVYRKPEEINKLLLTLGATDPHCQKVKTYLNYNDVANAQKEVDTVLVMEGSTHPVCIYLQSLVDVYRDYHIGGLGLAKDASAEAKALALSENNNELDSRGAAGLLELTKRKVYREWIQAKPNASNARIANQTENEDALAVLENINFKVYPNPSTGLFYYEYNVEENNNETATLTVIDMLGKVIITGTINDSNAKGMINLSELNNGIYFINISNSKKQLFTNKLSVVK